MSKHLLQRSRIGWPEAWRPIDRLLAQWVMAHGGDERLARWAGACSAAEGEGHTALALDDAARFGIDPESRDALDSPRWVGDGTTMTPFVLDDGARLYLWRYWQAEHRVAAALGATAKTARIAYANARQEGETAVDAAALASLFGSSANPREAAQREAVQRCGDARLFVLTGGPGTGKTTTVLRMLLARQRALGRPLRTLVAAPTGKAAQRLVDALRAGRSRLSELLGHSDWAPTLDAFALPEASTVHRLLGYQPTRQRYARDASDPIDAELVVIDEASMLDLESLDALLAALSPHASLWLVGDAEQLSPVGPGSAFQDLVLSLASRADAPLVRLMHSFRAEPALEALNQALRAGDAGATHAALAAPGLHHAPLTDADTLDAALRHWAQSLMPSARFEALPADTDAARAAVADTLASSSERQWLCATRDGPRGSIAVNARLDALLRAASERRRLGSTASADDAGQVHYAGRRLLITRNDAGTSLFNGDIGVVLADADGCLRAWFDGPEDPRAVPLGVLPPHEPAWALTVHKSQGSEYAEVAVLLPTDSAHRVLSRELLYTAASRAKRALALHADMAVIEACLARPVRRAGGLHVRLAEAFAPIAIVAAVIADPKGRVLLVRKRGSMTFIQPGGKREPGEAALTALARELEEELGVTLIESSAVRLGEFEAEAVNEPGRRVRAEAFAVAILGTPTARAEIAELAWLDPAAAFPVPVAPLSARHILPAWRASLGEPG